MRIQPPYPSLMFDNIKIKYANIKTSSTVHDYSTTAFKNIPLSNSCKRTWWYWGNATYSAGCTSNTPPKTKQERVNREEFQWHGGNCTMSLVDTVACICKSWYYYWSDEEGCISRWNIIQSKVLESLE